MSIINDPCVTEHDDGYRVAAKDGTVFVMPNDGVGHFPWAAYFAPADAGGHRSPREGITGSGSTTAEDAIRWALR